MGPKYIPYTYMDPLGMRNAQSTARVTFRQVNGMPPRISEPVHFAMLPA